jgi:hypothetical protein
VLKSRVPLAFRRECQSPASQYANTAPTNQQADLTRFVGFSGVLHSWRQINPQKNLTREGSFEGRVRIHIVVLWTKSQQSLGLWLVGAEGLEPPTC